MPAGRRGSISVVDPLDDVAADVVDPVLVEGDDDGGDGAVLGHEIAAQQRIAQHAVTDA